MKRIRTKKRASLSACRGREYLEFNRMKKRWVEVLEKLNTNISRTPFNPYTEIKRHFILRSKLHNNVIQLNYTWYKGKMLKRNLLISVLCNIVLFLE